MIDHGHPGAHGVEVDKNRATSESNTIGVLYLLMHLAVTTHPRMNGARATAPYSGPLDGMADRDAHQRLAGLAQLGMQTASDHDAIVARLTALLRMTEEDTRGFVEDDVEQYFAYIEAAKQEWAALAHFDFDPHMIGIVSTSPEYHNLVAVANALNLSMAEALVWVRNLMAATVARPTEDRPTTEQQRRIAERRAWRRNPRSNGGQF